MKKIAMIAMGALAMGAVSQSHAADIGVGVKGGMLGLGAELTVGLTDTLNGRLGYNTYTFKASRTESDIAYDVDMKWQTTAFLLDWHPNGGTFRVTAGYMLNGNKLEMTAKAASDYTINDQTYTAAQIGSLTSKVDFEDAPYIGIGWGNAAKRKGFGFSFELGAMYQQSPKVSLSCTGAACSSDDTLVSNLRAEEQSLKSDLSAFEWYPQVAFGVSYAF